MCLICEPDLQHTLFLLTFSDKLGMAPPCDKGACAGHVLDIGTGTGIWAIDFGDEHPEAEVCYYTRDPNIMLMRDRFVE